MLASFILNKAERHFFSTYHYRQNPENKNIKKKDICITCLKVSCNHFWNQEEERDFPKESKHFIRVQKPIGKKKRKSFSAKEPLPLTYPWAKQEHCPSWKRLDVTQSYLWKKKHQVKKVKQDILEIIFSKRVFHSNEETRKGDEVNASELADGLSQFFNFNLAS